jgi:predicted ATPase/DNA-binding SARP family transcriptional activator
MLHVQLLGDFCLVYHEQPVKGIDKPRLQSLLAYLLLHRDTPQSRQHLAFLLWPDSSEAQARTNLRKLLHQLRQTLPAADRFLYADMQTVQWRSDALVTLDVFEFERAVRQAQSTTSLRESINLYRGELLPGCYDDWLLSERERLGQMFSETLERLVTLLEAERDYRTALSYAQRLLRYDPLREETYQLLMRLHALAGDRAGALRVYQTCVEVLKRELDVEVSSMTHEVYEQVVKLEAATTPSATLPDQARTHNLPIQLASFIGRERELAEVKRWLQQTRLLTLTGPGGCGKTRLALQAASEMVGGLKDGVWLVELAALSDPTLVPQTVASMLGVREQPERALLDTLTDYLQAKELLLILDNCEHLLAACARLSEVLLRSCAQMRILATSRERLNVLGEIVRPAPPLSLPASHRSTLDTLLQSEAIRLFIERAAAVLPTFALAPHNAVAVAQICQRLDGIPLALELAAARVRLLTPAQIANRLDDLFQLLTHGSQVAPPRQQTLRATMDWSYALLSRGEQGLFQELAVFAGSWSLEAAEAICKDEGGTLRVKDEIHPSEVLELLSQLIDKSLVMAEMQGGEARYRMLEPIRQYAAEKLRESGELDQVQERHCHFFLLFAEETESKLKGPEQVQWLNRLEIEYDNLRAALSWALAAGKAELSLRLVVGLNLFWRLRDYLNEGRAWTEQALRQTPTPEQTESRGRALNALMHLATFQGDYAAARSLADESLGLFLKLRDKQGIADTLQYLGNMTWHQSDYAVAQSFLEQGLALFREMGDKLGIADTLHYLGHVMLDQGRYQQADTLFRDSLSLFREVGPTESVATLVGDVGLLVYLQEDYALARAFLEESLALFQETASQDGTAMSLHRLGDLARREGDDDRAEMLYLKSLALFQRTGRKAFMAGVLHNLGYVAQHRSDFTLALARFRESLHLFQDLADRKGTAECLMGLAGVAGAQGDREQAARLFGAAEALREVVGATLWPANRLEYERNLTNLRAQLDEALFAQAWAEGRAMTLEAAIDDALAKTKP